MAFPSGYRPRCGQTTWRGHIVSRRSWSPARSGSTVGCCAICARRLAASRTAASAAREATRRSSSSPSRRRSASSSRWMRRDIPEQPRFTFLPISSAGPPRFLDFLCGHGVLFENGLFWSAAILAALDCFSFFPSSTDSRWCPSCVARSQISRENAGLGALVFTQFSQHFSGAQSSGDTTKIRLEQSRLDTLRAQKSALGDAAKGAKKITKDIERQEALLGELQDFEEKLRRAANLDFGKNLDSSVIYDPDLNDGVVLNIAPLWELVPWKEAKGYWDELLAGEYEWSSMGKLLRKKGLVK